VPRNVTQKSHPILVALIGFAGVVIAAFLAYLGATGGFSAPTFQYTGVIRDVLKNPVGDAKVRISEDEKVPQTVKTDSEGVFSAWLSKKTKSIRIDVEADGYEPYSLNVSPSRTGPEQITLPAKKLHSEQSVRPPTPTLFQGVLTPLPPASKAIRVFVESALSKPVIGSDGRFKVKIGKQPGDMVNVRVCFGEKQVFNEGKPVIGREVEIDVHAPAGPC
jgi:hypothetical protein